MFEINLLLILLLGIVVGFLDSTLGAGGWVSLPFLIFLGLTPQAAIAVDRLGTIGQTFAALLKYIKAKSIRWDYIIPFVILSQIATLIGTKILLSSDPKILQKILGLVLVILLPFLFTNKNLGVIRKHVNNFRKTLGLTIYFLLLIFNGIFGVGTGVPSFYNSMYNFGFTIIEANSTNLIPWFLLSVSSTIIFINKGILDFRSGIFFVLGMIVGGYIGAHVALKAGNLKLKKALAVVVVLAGIKLLFF